jgi:hypothetical protein
MWFYAGELHREDAPAIIRADGIQEWYWHGQRHRNGDLPAIVFPDGIRMEYYKYGKWHRGGDLPAIIFDHRNMSWYKHGYLHRDGDQPAVLLNNDYEWYQNGLMHRDGGKPAAIWPSFGVRWAHHGMIYAEIKI